MSDSNQIENTIVNGATSPVNDFKDKRKKNAAADVDVSSQNDESRSESNAADEEAPNKKSRTSDSSSAEDTEDDIISSNDIQNPRQLLAHLLPGFDISKLSSSVDDFEICRLIYQIMSSSTGANGQICIDPATLFIQQYRTRLSHINTIEQCVELIRASKNIIVLTGAGCSVSCGIPDFRSRDGIYSRLRIDFPDLPDPQAMFDIYYFEHDPRPFFKFAKEIYPGQFTPSISHMFIKKLEEKQRLLRNYTQNIDTLETVAKIQNVIQCHGSFATATCTTCKFKVDSDYIKEKIFKQEIPYCDKCKSNEIFKNNNSNEQDVEENASSNEVVVVESEPMKTKSEASLDVDTTTTNSNENNDSSTTASFLSSVNAACMLRHQGKSAGILKPDIVFFGEGLPDLYHRSINEDKHKCDLLIVIGSSLKVKPVANIPYMLDEKVPQILINRESLKHMNFDIELLGDCDVIVNELLLRLEDDSNWSDICKSKAHLSLMNDDEAKELINNAFVESGCYDSDEEESMADDDADDESLSSSSSESASGDESATTAATAAASAVANPEDAATDAADKNDSNGDETLQVKKKPMQQRDFLYKHLKENCFIHFKPNMYVFHGAEMTVSAAKKKLDELADDAKKSSEEDDSTTTTTTTTAFSREKTVSAKQFDDDAQQSDQYEDEFLEDDEKH